LDGITRREFASRALCSLERAIYLNTNELHRYRTLPNIACSAFEAGDWHKARVFAIELLDKAALPDYLYQRNGDAIHFGNTVLGRMALLEGNVDEAKSFLLSSGKTTGSPFLRACGPSMVLANELLLRGERDVVVQFLQLCSSFWKTNDHRAEQWIYQILNGIMPDISSNLSY
jgi:hypothetical protein